MPYTVYDDLNFAKSNSLAEKKQREREKNIKKVFVGSNKVSF